MSKEIHTDTPILANVTKHTQPGWGSQGLWLEGPSQPGHYNIAKGFICQLIFIRNHFTEIELRKGNFAFKSKPEKYLKTAGLRGNQMSTTFL